MACTSMKAMEENIINKKTFHGKHIADTQGEILFEDDNDMDDSVPHGGQHGIMTTAIGTSTSRATSSSIVIGNASPTVHFGLLRFMVVSLLVFHMVFLLLDKSSH